MDSIIFYTALLIFLLSILSSYIINNLIIKITINKQVESIERKFLYFHTSKKNTPILGGLSIILSVIISFIIYSIIFEFDEIIFISILSLTLFGIVGLIDDLKKIKKKNSDGLSPYLRLVLESLIALLIMSLLGFNFEILKDLNINGLKFGLFTFPLFIFLFLGGSNASNLTDGLDGLDAGLSLIALLPNLFLAFKLEFFLYAFFFL